MGKSTIERVADMLEELASGGTVSLDDFSDNASPATDADEEAALLHDIAHGLREGSIAPAQ